MVHYVVFLGKALDFHIASLYPDVWMGTGKFDAGVVGGGGGKGGNPVMDQCPIHGDQISQNKYYLSIFEIYTQFKILVLCFLFYVQGSMNGQRR